MKSDSLFKETFVSSILFFLLILLLGLIPLKFEFIKPIKQGFDNFDIYDFKFSRNSANIITDKDSQIVIVEAAKTREEILRQITFIKTLNPKVIGVDIEFRGSQDKLIDDKLQNIILKDKKVVGGFVIDSVIENNIHVDNQLVNLQNSNNDDASYYNFHGDGQYSVIRSFLPSMKYKDIELTSFGVKVASEFDSIKATTFLKRGNKKEFINYFGGMEKFISYNFGDIFKVKEKEISNKIVLIGSFSKDNSETMDLKFTPINSKPNGKSLPDMYGVFVHANIIHMILHGQNFICELSNFWTSFIAFLIILSYSYLLLVNYSKYSHPSHLIFLILSIALCLLIAFLFLVFYNSYNIRVDLSIIFMSLFIPLEFFEIYKYLAKYLHKIFGYSTIFSKSH